MQQVNTSCQYCVFRVNDADGQQISCGLDRINKFKRQNVPLEMVDNHIVLKNRFCNALRNEKWLEKNADNDPIAAVHKEIAIDYDVIVVVNSSEQTYKDIEKSVLSVVAQSPCPKNIRVSLAKHECLTGNVMSLLSDTVPEHIGYYVDDIKEEKELRNWDVVDISAEKSKTMYYATLNAGYKLDSDYASKINCSLNYEMDRFCLLRPINDINAMFVLKKAHKMMTGSYKMVNKDHAVLDTIVDKLLMLSSEDTADMVKEFKDICQIQK